MLLGTDERHQDIVRKVELVARQQPGTAVHIRSLCRTCGVSERTLRNAFHSIHGKTPYRHLRELRMLEARQALLSATSPNTTVTSVATRFGFYELGRFSVEYRLAFGERPSETLRRVSAGCPSYLHGHAGVEVSAVA